MFNNWSRLLKDFKSSNYNWTWLLQFRILNWKMTSWFNDFNDLLSCGLGWWFHDLGLGWWIHFFITSWFHGFMISWLYDFMTLWLGLSFWLGLMNSWLHDLVLVGADDFITSWFGFYIGLMTIWLHDFMTWS